MNRWDFTVISRLEWYEICRHLLDRIQCITRKHLHARAFVNGCLEPPSLWGIIPFDMHPYLDELAKEGDSIQLYLASWSMSTKSGSIMPPCACSSSMEWSNSARGSCPVERLFRWFRACFASPHYVHHCDQRCFYRKLIAGISTHSHSSFCQHCLLGDPPDIRHICNAQS